MRYTIDVSGTSREYILAVPSNYNPNTPYRLIFAWHPWGGSAQQVAGSGNSGYYGLKGSSNNQAILVSPEGTDFGGNGLGWGNSNGQDIAFLRAMLVPFYESGALYGETAEDAFEVNVGQQVNTPETIAAGELHAVLEVRMSPFAEKVVIEIVKVDPTVAIAA